MRGDISRDLFQLCLNSIHGKDHFLYRELSRERVKELALWVVDLEHKESLRILHKFKTLSEEDRKKLMEELKETVVQEVHP